MAEARARQLTARPARSTTRRVVDLLAVFLDGREDAGVSELARAVGTSKSVVHRILQGLTESGFMISDPVTRRYRLGGMMIRLGLVAVRHMDLKTTSLPYLRAIHEQTAETALLGLLRGDRRIYLAQIEAQHSVRSTVQLGHETPLYLGASGKAMLAFVPRALSSAVLASARGQRLATGAPIRIGELTNELGQIRRTRIALSANELAVGAAAVASPIFDEHGQVIGSLGVASVSIRTDRRTLSRYGVVAKTQADRLSKALGWTGRISSD